jgi:hypothetical protein
MLLSVHAIWGSASAPSLTSMESERIGGGGGFGAGAAGGEHA